MLRAKARSAARSLSFTTRRAGGGFLSRGASGDGGDGDGGAGGAGAGAGAGDAGGSDAAEQRELGWGGASAVGIDSWLS